MIHTYTKYLTGTITTNFCRTDALKYSFSQFTISKSFGKWNKLTWIWKKLHLEIHKKTLLCIRNNLIIQNQTQSTTTLILLIQSIFQDYFQITKITPSKTC